MDVGVRKKDVIFVANVNQYEGKSVFIDMENYVIVIILCCLDIRLYFHHHVKENITLSLESC